MADASSTISPVSRVGYAVRDPPARTALRSACKQLGAPTANYLVGDRLRLPAVDACDLFVYDLLPPERALFFVRRLRARHPVGKVLLYRPDDPRVAEAAMALRLDRQISARVQAPHRCSEVADLIRWIAALLPPSPLPFLHRVLSAGLYHYGDEVLSLAAAAVDWIVYRRRGLPSVEQIREGLGLSHRRVRYLFRSRKHCGRPRQLIQATAQLLLALEAQTHGLSLPAVGRRLGIPRKTVDRWRRELTAHARYPYYRDLDGRPTVRLAVRQFLETCGWHGAVRRIVTETVLEGWTSPAQPLTSRVHLDGPTPASTAPGWGSGAWPTRGTSSASAP